MNVVLFLFAFLSALHSAFSSDISEPVSELSQLVLSGDLMAVQLFLVDPFQSPAVNENEAIRIASRNGFVDILEYLLSFKYDVDPTARNNEAMRMAMANGHLGVIKVLLTDDRVNPTEAFLMAMRNPLIPLNGEVFRILCGCPRIDSTRVLKIVTTLNMDPNLTEILLIHDDADPNPSIPISYMNGLTVHLRLLLSHRRADKMLRIVDAFNRCQIALPNPISEPRQAISAAIFNDNDKFLNFILYHTNIEPSLLQEAFRFAASTHRVKAFQILLSSSLVDPAFNGNEALLEAIKSANVEIVTMLIQHPNVDPGANRNEALHVALFARNIRILEVLLQSDKVNPNDRDGVFLPLILERLPVKLLGLLLNHPRCHPSVNSNFALRVALRRKDTSSVKGILCNIRRRKVDPNIPVYEASTPLLEAVKSGYCDIVSHLIGFTMYSPTLDDLERALDLAKQKKYEKIVVMLEAFKEFEPKRISKRPDGLWSFSVDPARILVWLRTFIRDKHARDGTDVAAAMTKDILTGRSIAYSLTCRDQDGFEPLKLAYEDFTMSRPEMPEADRIGMFVRIMTTDYVPEFRVYESQPGPLSAFGFWQSQVMAFTPNAAQQAPVSSTLSTNAQVLTAANQMAAGPPPTRPPEGEAPSSVREGQADLAVPSDARQSEEMAPACKRRRMAGQNETGAKGEAEGKEPEDHQPTDWISREAEECPPPVVWYSPDLFDFELQW